MKAQSLFILFLLGIGMRATAQNIQEVENVHMRQVAPIVKNGEITGYYALCKSNQKVKGKEIYQLTLLNADLNTTVSKLIEKDKGLHATDMVFNGTHLCVHFMNHKGKWVECDIYDLQGETTGSYSFMLSEGEAKQFKLTLNAYSNPQTPGILEALPGIGFVRYEYVMKTDTRVNIQAFDNSGKKLWRGVSEVPGEKVNEKFIASTIAGDYLFTYITKIEGRKMKTFGNVVLVHDLRTGKLVSSFSDADSDTKTNMHGVYYNATKKEYIVYGAYAEKQPDASNDYYRKGFYFQVLSSSGELTSTKYLDWETDLAPLFPKNAYKTSMVGGAFFLHELLETGDGYVLVGERYLQKMHIGIGVGVNVNAGGGAGSSTGPTASVDLESHNMYVMNVNADLVATKGKIIEKEVHSVNQVYVIDYTGMMMFEIGHTMNRLSLFDYLTGSANSTGDFACTYQDVDKMKNKSTKLFLMQMNFSGTTSSKDVLSESRDYRLLRAADGGAVIVEYKRKEKAVVFKKL